MSLATRCPACGTVFRVVQDQLRVSEGWVRCGRCAQVFNAVDRLVDLDAEHQAASGAGGHRARVMDDLAQVGSSGAETAPPGWLDTPSLHPAGGPDASAEDRRSHQASDDGLHEPALSDFDDEPDDSDAVRGGAPLAPFVPSAPVREPDLRAEAPSFVRQADRAASWRRSPRRAVLAGAVLLAAGALIAQAALEYRDALAARWSGLRPALEQACRWTGCTVEPPRMIDALVVESSGLVRVDATSMYRLSVVLRNRAGVDLAVPAIDLSLTDAQGRVTARRVLSLAELGQPARQLPAGGELPMKAVLAAAGAPVTGYTIDLFYP